MGMRQRFVEQQLQMGVVRANWQQASNDQEHFSCNHILRPGC
jgi:hypothetical protein